ncbi:hypothetical protein ACFSX5_12985 [Devosia albogilva]|uniref:Flagellar motor protein n=1 Tax=Devosia albogilva TaxID=429726 RepID=A0ABW5QM76_9HYPH
MTAMLLRVIILAIIGLIIVFGARRIWRDWQKSFKAEDEEVRRLRRERDLRERERPDVIDLEQGPDGTYRPGRKDEDTRR